MLKILPLILLMGCAQLGLTDFDYNYCVDRLYEWNGQCRRSYCVDYWRNRRKTEAERRTEIFDVIHNK